MELGTTFDGPKSEGQHQIGNKAVIYRGSRVNDLTELNVNFNLCVAGRRSNELIVVFYINNIMNSMYVIAGYID